MPETPPPEKKRPRFRMEPKPATSQESAPVYPTVKRRVSRQPDRQSESPHFERGPDRFDSLHNAAQSVDHTSLQHAITGFQDLEADPEPEWIGQRLVQNRYPVSSILVSLAFHIAFFLALILIAFGWKKTTTPTIQIIAEFYATPILEKSPSFDDSPNVKIELPDDFQSPVENTFIDNSTSDHIAAPESVEAITNVVTENVTPTVAEPIATNGPRPTLPTGGGLDGRDPSKRGKLAASRGGSRASENAVERGIQWLLAHQRDDGSFRLGHDDGRCNGQCENPGKMESTTAATGLVLMAMLGAGYTHRAGPYQKEVQAAIDYLLEKMRISKHGGSLAQGEKGMYSHAIATIALAEAYTMTHDTSLVQSIEFARAYIESAQHKKGGWRYFPGTAGDMTVTGWQLMALKSCELAKFPTPPKTWKNAEAFIDSLASTSGSFGYLEPEEKPTTTAVGVLSKMYLGASLENDTQEMGTRLIEACGPSKTDVYFNYYATQVLLHRNDPGWPRWNEELRDYLIKTQDRGNTHQSGSWYFPDPHGQMGGRLYTTAMVIMTLEVYYRFLPLYEDNVIK